MNTNMNVTICTKLVHLNFKDPRNQGSQCQGGALALAWSRLGVPSSKFSLPRLVLRNYHDGPV